MTGGWSSSQTVVPPWPVSNRSPAPRCSHLARRRFRPAGNQIGQEGRGFSYCWFGSIEGERPQKSQRCPREGQTCQSRCLPDLRFPDHSAARRANSSQPEEEGAVLLRGVEREGTGEGLVPPAYRSEPRRSCARRFSSPAGDSRRRVFRCIGDIAMGRTRPRCAPRRCSSPARPAYPVAGPYSAGRVRSETPSDGGANASGAIWRRDSRRMEWCAGRNVRWAGASAVDVAGEAGKVQKYAPSRPKPSLWCRIPNVACASSKFFAFGILWPGPSGPWARARPLSLLKGDSQAREPPKPGSLPSRGASKTGSLPSQGPTGGASVAR